MTSEGFCLFDTAIGACGLAWNDRGLSGVRLPDPSAEATRARMQRRFPAATEQTPPARIVAAIEAIQALLGGEPRDLSGIPVDLDAVDEPMRRIYAVLRTIPPGETVSYGEVAKRAGLAGGAQAVGQAMGRNPWPIVVPCHRVVGSGGKLGGFSAPGGARTKLRLLEIERALAPETLPLFASPSA